MKLSRESPIRGAVTLSQMGAMINVTSRNCFKTTITTYAQPRRLSSASNGFSESIKDAEGFDISLIGDQR